MMRKGTWVALLMVLFVGQSGFAQGGLDLANVLKVLEDLKNQVQTLQQSFTEQGTQIANLNDQIKGLSDQWPAVQEMAQTFSSLQTQLSDQLKKVSQLQQAISTLAQPNAEPRVDALQAQMMSLQQDVQVTRAENEAMQSQLNATQGWTWLALGGVVLLVIVQIVSWARNL